MFQILEAVHSCFIKHASVYLKTWEVKTDRRHVCRSYDPVLLSTQIL